MRSVFPYFTNPFGHNARPGTAGLVDKFIGNAFPIVEFVARNMTHVRRVSHYMKNVYDASQRLTVVVPAIAPDTANNFVEVELPMVIIEDEAGAISNRQVRPEDVVGWTATLTDSNGNTYCDRHDLWTLSLTAEGVFQITLPPEANAVLLGAPMKILVDYIIPPVE